MSSLEDSQVDATLRLALQNEINENMEKGIAYFKRGQYEKSVAHFSEGIDLVEQVYGSNSLVYADACVEYGRVLLQNAVANASPLGDKSNKQNEKEKEKEKEDKREDNVKVEDEQESDDESEDEYDYEEEEEVPNMKGKIFCFESDIDRLLDETEEGEEEATNNNVEGELEGQEDDFTLAFQILDVARKIYQDHIDSEDKPIQSSSKQIIEEISEEKINQVRIKLSEVYLVIGEVYLESENFTQALLEYRDAVKIQYACLEPHDRRIAEAHYKIAITYEYLNQREEAKNALSTVVEVLDSRIESLDAEKDEEEIKECKELINDIKLRVEDLDEPQPDIIAQVAKELFGAEEPFQDVPEDAKEINNLIKRKNKDDNKDDENNKKIKQ